MPASYKQPRRLNIVSIAILLALAAGAYYAWKWGPPYYMSWQVGGILEDGGSSIPRWGSASPDERRDYETQLAAELRTKIVALGITDPALTVTVDDDGTDAHLTAEWTVMITHPNGWHAPTPDHFVKTVVQPLHAGL